MSALAQGDRPSSLDVTVASRILKTAMQHVHFKNWSETYECSPELFFAPKTEEEVKDILLYARESGKKVRVVGQRHSPSDITCTDDIMISLQHFNKVIEIEKKMLQVKVQAGMVMSDLNDYLYLHNMALSVLGSISDITVGGAISVATHGSGIKFGTLSSFVTEICIMLSNGSILNLSAENNPDLFLAAACSLGCFGIILNVTLQCEPAYNLHLSQFGLDLKNVIENLSVHLQVSDHFKFLWYPHTDGVVVFHYTRTEATPPKQSWFRRLWEWFAEYGIGYYTLEFLLYLSTFFPQMVPSINRFYYNLMFSSAKSKVDRSYRIFNYDCLFKQYVNEWAIPVEKCGLVLWQIHDWIESTPTAFIHFPIEVRFVKAEEIYLSPAYGQDTCYINIIMYRPYGKDVSYEEYWSAYESIMLNAGGRPHWAKAHTVTAETFTAMYPEFKRWCTIRQKLDPMNMFLNSYMLRIFRNSVMY